MIFACHVLETTRQSPEELLKEYIQKILNRDYGFQATTADKAKDEFYPRFLYK